MEPTYAALDVACYLRGRGCTPRWLTPTASGVELHKYWDQRRRPAASVESYVDACQQSDVVVWTHLPRAEDLAAARRAGVRSCYLHSWDEAVPDDSPILTELDVIVAPHPQAAALLSREYGLGPRVVACPWGPAACGLRRGEAAPGPSALVWIDGPGQYNTSESALAAAGVLLDSAPDASVAIAISGPAGRASRLLAAAARRSGGRLTVRRPPAYDEIRDALAGVDLVVYPAQFAAFGHVALWCAACATPCVCFDCAPFAAPASAVDPGCVVPCRTGRTEGGMAYVEDYDPARLFRRAAELLPRRVASRGAAAVAFTDARRRGFEAAISGLFS